MRTFTPWLLALLTVPMLPAAAVQLYRTPVAPQALPADQAKGCPELEREIAALLPLTYSYKPNFYQDPYQGGSIFLGVVAHPVLFAPVAYSGWVEYEENKRMIPAEDRIEQLRRLKAEKHCYEK